MARHEKVQVDDEHDHEHNDELQPEIWTYSVLAAAIPLFCMGYYFVGVCFVAIAILYRVLAPQKISPRDQLQIQYNVWSADDVMNDLERRKICRDEAVTRNGDEQPRSVDLDEKAFHTALLVALPSMARKFNNKHQQQKRIREIKSKNSDSKLTSAPANECQDPVMESLALICQQAVYLSLAAYPDDNHIVDASFGLLALVGKSELVRERHLHEADKYGLDVLTKCMTQSLKRAKDVDGDEGEEQEMAEIQRKGCLMLGALADADSAVTLQIVRDGGLVAILEAISWYRYHVRLANWALWAIFTLCYENNANKVALLELDGIPIVLRVMENCAENVEVTRHGIAILFDLLRDGSAESSKGSNPQLRKIQETAVAAGLHPIVLKAIDTYSDSPNNVNIVMMGRELLAGTGYR